MSQAVPEGQGRRPGVLFDVDGTLVDTNYLHTLAWSRGFLDAGEWVPMHAIHRLVGMGSDQLVVRLLGHESRKVNEARMGHYKELLQGARPFPEAGDLLRRVHDSGVAVVLASSSPAEELDTLRQLIDANEAIDAQTTADDIDSSKPAPDVFLRAMEVAWIDPLRALAVGDSKWDVQGARAAGIGCVGVESGGFSQHELSEAGALFVYRDVEELYQQLYTSPLQALMT